MSVRDLEIKGKLNKFEIVRTNKNISKVNLIRKLFLDTNTKRAFHLRGSYKKA